MPIQPHTYYQLVNVKSGTALDLSGTDGTSIIGWEEHQGDNQKWLLDKIDGNHWSFRNKSTGRYLGFARGIQGITNGLSLIGVNEPVKWDIWPDDENQSIYRIFVPGAPAPGVNIDLADHGDPSNGTPVVLWGKWEPGSNQTWIFKETH